MPIFTFSVIFLSVTAYAVPELSAFLIYDREAILAGEVWRLLSAHLVHFSTEHLVYDLLAFGIAGWIIESRGYRFFELLCFLMALFISIALFIAEPQMSYYGGLSGVACGAIVYFALFGLRESTSWHVVCMMILLFMSARLVIEACTGNFLFVSSNTLFMPMALSHIAGSLVALILFLLQASRKETRNVSSMP